MASTSRMAVFIGAVFAVLASACWLVLQRHSFSAPYIDPLALTISLIIGSVLFGVLCGAGAFAGMRLAGVRSVSYRFGILVVVCYLAALALINLVPAPVVTITVGSGDWQGPLAGLAMPVVVGLVLPGIIAYVLARVVIKPTPGA